MPPKNPVAAIRSLARSLVSLTEEQRDLRESINELRARIETLAHREFLILQAIHDSEPLNRRLLWELRERPDYERAFEDENPLVTIYVTTYSNAAGLATRSLPSILGQTYENLEVLVVGDAATPEVEEAVRSFDDERLRFVNLTVRGPYPEDDVGLWLVAGTSPANEGLRLAAGDWIGMNCDDDVFTPDHVQTLLAEARRRRLELVYGKMRRLDPGGKEILIGTFPPTSGEFGVQAALHHRILRMFPHELSAALFSEPGDWSWVRRMMRLGVKIGMIDDVVVDYYPSQLWGTPARAARLLG